MVVALIERGRYRLVDADIGKLIKVEVSFTDSFGTLETVTSQPFGPVPRPAPLRESTLVSNTGQSASATANITGRYDMGFELGDHGQGYEISSVSIELAAAPSSLTVSLWTGRANEEDDAGAYTKLFDFENPSSFQVGLNGFTAPAGAFAYQKNVRYFIVLSDFGASLSIKETTSDNEDAGGETGATLGNSAGGDSSVLRLAVKGSQRDRGILVSTYTQVRDEQEIVSLGDEIGFGITVGAADRYLIRGVTLSGDSTTVAGLFTNPWQLRDGTDELFRMVSTRQMNGINEFTAPQGATVPGGCTTDTVTMVETCEEYNFFQDIKSVDRMGGVILSRHFGTSSTAEDSPKAAGVTIGSPTGNFALQTPLMAVFGEPLDAMVQNLGQTDNSGVSLGGASAKVLSQGFTTGSDGFRYRLQGIGVNIEGSGSNFPDDSASVSVAVHADSSGPPGDKLFDLLSPTEYAAGHSFFEAPPGTYLDPSTSYVLVWRHNSGTAHRLQQTRSDSEDSGGKSGSSIANAFYRGADLGSLSEDSGGNALEFAVYTEVLDALPTEIPHNWALIPDGLSRGDTFRLLFATSTTHDATSTDIADYNTFVQTAAAAGHAAIQDYSEGFRAVASTADIDARDNTATTGAGTNIYWLDGNQVADDNADFYDGDWDDEANATDESGAARSLSAFADLPWTGSNDDGTERFGGNVSNGLGGLGNASAGVGGPDASNSTYGPLSGDQAIRNNTRPFYAISELFEGRRAVPPTEVPDRLAARPR